MSLIYLISIILAATILVIVTELEWFGWSTLLILSSFAAVHFFHIANVGDFILGHPLLIITYFLCYIATGTVWSFAKWAFFLLNARTQWRKEFDEKLELSKHYHSINPLAPINIKLPQAIQNKGRIIAWIMYWPFSFVGTILNDPIRKLFNFIFDRFKNLYQHMVNFIFKEDIQRLKNAEAEFAAKNNNKPSSP